MIHQVRIKSLPQEWLWCETWCSDESKESAKTIDLVNTFAAKQQNLTEPNFLFAVQQSAHQRAETRFRYPNYSGVA